MSDNGSIQLAERLDDLKSRMCSADCKLERNRSETFRETFSRKLEELEQLVDHEHRDIRIRDRRQMDKLSDEELPGTNLMTASPKRPKQKG